MKVFIIVVALSVVAVLVWTYWQSAKVLRHGHENKTTTATSFTPSAEDAIFDILPHYTKVHEKGSLKATHTILGLDGSGFKAIAGGADRAFITPALPGSVSRHEIDEMLAKYPAKRFRIVTVDSDYLFSLIRGTEPSELTLHLFDDVVVTSQSFRTEDYAEGIRAGYGAWNGKIKDREYGSVVLISAPDAGISGSIMYDRRAFGLHPLSSHPYHFLYELDAD